MTDIWHRLLAEIRKIKPYLFQEKNKIFNNTLYIVSKIRTVLLNMQHPDHLFLKSPLPSYIHSITSLKCHRIYFCLHFLKPATSFSAANVIINDIGMFEQDSSRGWPHHQYRRLESGRQLHLPPAPFLRQAQVNHGHLAVGEPDEASGAA